MTEIIEFRVEFLTGETVDLGYDPDTADEIADLLDQATTILGCPDCGDLAPVTGGIPTERMPRCPGCQNELKGVTEVHRLEDS